MKPLRLDRVRDALVIAPHPDDETIGAYGLIRRLIWRGARVRVIVAADGAASHPASLRWPRRRLIVERRRETRAAMRRVGVTAAKVRFLGLPDGSLSDLTRCEARALSREIARARRADLLVLPARDDDHPDHRAIARIAAAAGARTARRIEYLVWPDRDARRRPAVATLRLGTAAAAKRGAIRRYRTQTGAIDDDPNGFAISRAELARFSRPLELYREIRR